MPDIDLRRTVKAENDDQLLTKLGSFWNEQFQDREVVRQMLRATEDLGVQAEIDLKERLLIARDLPNAPLYHREVWWRIILTEADLTEEHPNALAYSPDNPAYGPNNQAYGAGLPTLWSFGLPESLVNVRCVANRITGATYLGYRGDAFFYRPGIIGFRRNPLKDPLFEQTETQNGPGVVIWLYMTDWDFELLHQHWSIPTQAAAPTSEDYRKVIQGLFEARVRGPSRHAFYKVVSGSTGVPLCESDGEVVEWIGLDSQRLVIVTDRQVYRYPTSHNAIVAVGDTLSEGQALTDALSVRDIATLRSGDEPILIPPSYFAPDANVQQPLLFPNERVPVIDLGTDDQGNRVISFELHGQGGDILRYRRYAAAAGVARLLDKRGPNAPTVPGPENLRATVNPAIELIRDTTRPNLVVVRGDSSRWPASSALRQAMQRQLDQLLPPHGRVIIQDDLAVDALYDFSSQSVSSVSSQSSSQSLVSSSSTSGSTSSQSSASQSSQSDVSTSSSRSNSLSSTSSTSSVSDVSTSSSTASSNTSSSSSSRSSRSDVSTSSSSRSSQSSSLTSLSSNSSVTQSSATSNLSSQSSASQSTASSVTGEVLTSSSSDSSSTAWMLGSTTSSASSTSSVSQSSDSSGYYPYITILRRSGDIRRTEDCGTTGTNLPTAPYAADGLTVIDLFVDEPGSDASASDYFGVLFVTVEGDHAGTDTTFNQGTTWRSADSGATWVRTGFRFNAMAFKNGPSGFILGLVERRVYRSNDRGVTWTYYSELPTVGGPAGPYVGSGYITPDRNTAALCAVYDEANDSFVIGCESEIFTSVDNGLTWIPQTALSHPFGINLGGHRLVANAGTIIIAKAHRVCRSTDGGLTWGNYYGHNLTADGSLRWVQVIRWNPVESRWILFGFRQAKYSPDGETWSDLGVWTSDAAPTGSPTPLPQLYEAFLVFCDDPTQWLMLTKPKLSSASLLYRITNGTSVVTGGLAAATSSMQKLVRLTPNQGIPNSSSSSSSLDNAADSSTSSTSSATTASLSTPSQSSQSDGIFQQVLFLRGEVQTTSTALTTAQTYKVISGSPDYGFSVFVDRSQVDDGSGVILGFTGTPKPNEYYLVWHSLTATNRHGLYRSTDGGQTWTLTSNFFTNNFLYYLHHMHAFQMPDGTIRLLVMNSGSGANCYTFGNGTLLATTSMSFTAFSPNFAWSRRASLSSTIVIVAVSSGRYRVSTDGGLTWGALTSIGIGGNAGVCHVSGQIWVISVSTRIYRSINDGTSWTQVYTGSDTFVGVSTGDNGTLMALTLAGTIVRSVDGGASWSVVASPYPGTIPYVPLSTMASIVYLENDRWLLSTANYSASYIGQNLWLSADNGLTWSSVVDPSAIPLTQQRVIGLRQAPIEVAQGVSSSSSSWHLGLDSSSSSSSADLAIDTTSSTQSTSSSISNTSSSSSSPKSDSSASQSSPSSNSPSSASPSSKSSVSDVSTSSSSDKSQSTVSASSNSSSSSSSDTISTPSSASSNSSSSSSSKSTASSKSSRSNQTSVSESSPSFSSASLVSDLSTNSSSSSSADLAGNTSSSSWPSSQSSRSESTKSTDSWSSPSSVSSDQSTESTSSGALAADNTSSSSTGDLAGNSTSSVSSNTSSSSSAPSDVSTSSSTGDNVGNSTSSSDTSSSGSSNTSSSSSSLSSQSPSSQSPSSNSPSSQSPSSGP